MSTGATRPGPRSLDLLDVVCRLGAAERRPLGLICNFGEATLDDHISRLVDAGYLRRKTHCGALVLLPTEKGWKNSAHRARPVTNYLLRHAVEVSWAAAWTTTESFHQAMEQTFELELKAPGHWLSESAMILSGPPWGPDGNEAAHIRRAQRAAVADIGVIFGNQAVLIEVELSAKAKGRLRRRFEMWESSWGFLRDESLKLAGVVYVYADQYVRGVVASVANERRSRFEAIRFSRYEVLPSDVVALRFAELAEIKSAVRAQWAQRRRPWAGARGA